MEEYELETVVLVVILLFFVGWIYGTGHKAGKREGSRKGYGVGFDRGRRSKSSGCLVAIAAIIVAMATASAALAYVL